MAKHDLMTCLALLPNLNDEERRQIHTRLGFLLKGQTPVDDDPSSDETLLMHAISKVMQSKGMEFCSISFLRNQSGYAAFRQKVPGLVRFMSQAGMRRQDLHAFMAFGLELLIEDMQSRNMLVGGRTLMNHVHRIPSVINRAFPGYAAAGLLSMIMKQGA